MDSPLRGWLSAIPSLPALSILHLYLNPAFLRGEPVDRTDASTTMSQVLLVCGCLTHCRCLWHLGLTVPSEELLHAPELLAAVGAAIGGRLQSLSLCYPQLPPARDAAARVMHTVVACFPRMEELSLQMCLWEATSGAKALLLRELLRALPTLAPLCPALRQVRVGGDTVQLQRRPDGSVAAVKLANSCFD